MNLRPLLICCAIVGVIYAPSAKAQAEEDLVEFRSIDMSYSAYRERRGSHGFLFGLNYENYYPKDMV